MATIEEKIQTALFTQVLALDFDNVPSIAWPNTPFPGVDGEGNELPKPDTYLEVRHHRNANSRLFVKGSNPHLRQGILQIKVVTPLNGGPGPADRLAGEIAARFPADYPLYRDGIKVRIQAAPDVGDAEPNGVSYEALISIRYDCFA